MGIVSDRQQPLLTVVVSAYNAEATIVPMLESLPLSSQVEIIVVDDKSSDRTVRRVKDFARLSGGRISIESHRYNLGLGGSRNTGLDRATGVWVWFVDDDDLACSHGVTLLLSALSRLNCGQHTEFDLVATPMRLEVRDRSDQPSVRRSLGKQACLQPLSVEEALLIQGHSCYTWLYVFRAEFLRKNQLRFIPFLKMQDVPFFWRVVSCSPRIGSWEEPIYHRVVRAGSAMTSQDVRSVWWYTRSMISSYWAAEAFLIRGGCSRWLALFSARVSGLLYLHHALPALNRKQFVWALSSLGELRSHGQIATSRLQKLRGTLGLMLGAGESRWVLWLIWRLDHLGVSLVRRVLPRL